MGRSAPIPRPSGHSDSAACSGHTRADSASLTRRWPSRNWGRALRSSIAVNAGPHGSYARCCPAFTTIDPMPTSPRYCDPMRPTSPSPTTLSPTFNKGPIALLSGQARQDHRSFITEDINPEVDCRNRQEARIYRLRRVIERPAATRRFPPRQQGEP